MGAYLESTDRRMCRIGYWYFSYTGCRCYVRTHNFTGTKLKAHEQLVDIETYCLHRRLWDKLTESRIVSVAFHSTARFRFKLLPLLGSDVDCPAVAFVA